MKLLGRIRLSLDYGDALAREGFRPSVAKCEYCSHRGAVYVKNDSGEIYCIRCSCGRLHYDTKCRMPEIFGREPAPVVPL